MVARNVVDSQRRSDPGSIPGGAIKCVKFFFFFEKLDEIFYLNKYYKKLEKLKINHFKSFKIILFFSSKYLKTYIL